MFHKGSWGRGDGTQVQGGHHSLRRRRELGAGGRAGGRGRRTERAWSWAPRAGRRARSRADAAGQWEMAMLGRVGLSWVLKPGIVRCFLNLAHFLRPPGVSRHYPSAAGKNDGPGSLLAPSSFSSSPCAQQEGRRNKQGRRGCSDS